MNELGSSTPQNAAEFVAPETGEWPENGNEHETVQDADSSQTEQLSPEQLMQKELRLAREAVERMSTDPAVVEAISRHPDMAERTPEEVSTLIAEKVSRVQAKLRILSDEEFTDYFQFADKGLTSKLAQKVFYPNVTRQRRAHAKNVGAAAFREQEVVIIRSGSNKIEKSAMHEFGHLLSRDQNRHFSPELHFDPIEEGLVEWTAKNLARQHFPEEAGRYTYGSFSYKECVMTMELLLASTQSGVDQGLELPTSAEQLFTNALFGDGIGSLDQYLDQGVHEGIRPYLDMAGTTHVMEAISYHMSHNTGHANDIAEYLFQPERMQNETQSASSPTVET